jgi:midasin (ATPase involved in ribosome maturation)
VTKTQVVLTSLVAALPGVVLSYLLVMVFLSYGGGKTVMMQALAAITLLLSIAAVLAPAGLWVFGGPAAPRKKKAAKDAEGGEGEEGDEDAAEVEEVEAADEDEEVETVAAASDEALEIESGEVEGFEDDVALEDEAMVEEVEDADTVTADSDAFEDVFDDIEEDEPKDKKKKR